MRLILGFDDYLLHTRGVETPVAWSLGAVVNAHMLLVGKSGNGKTHTLKRIVRQMAEAEHAPRIHIMDVHGDIGVNGASPVQFSESSGYGLNPLRISPHPHFGGTRRRVQDFVATVGAARALGHKQEAVIRHLLNKLYAEHGFLQHDASTWRIDGDPARRHPTVDDLREFAGAKLRQLALGADGKAARALEEVNRKAAGLGRKLRLAADSEDVDSQAAAEDIAKLKTEAIGAYAAYVNAIETGVELEDHLQLGGKDVLKSVVDRLDNLAATGIFKSAHPPFRRDAPVWRYDIAALREEEKRLFVEFRLQEIFAEAARRGPMQGGEERLRHVLVLDEAHLFFRDDPDNILNTIAKEGRKFGLALVCASQSPTHFSDDFVSNCGTKIVLGIDPMFWDGAARKMRIDLRTLKFIKPHAVMAVQMSLRGDAKFQFTMVRVSENRPEGQAAQTAPAEAGR
jgi:DNA helicase HerA-like ATPase